jgi:hypothetical protein
LLRIEVKIRMVVSEEVAPMNEHINNISRDCENYKLSCSFSPVSWPLQGGKHLNMSDVLRCFSGESDFLASLLKKEFLFSYKGSTRASLESLLR